MSMESREIRSGISALDQALQRIRLGDNVVWQIDDLEDYKFFARPFAAQAIQDGFECVYLRFAEHSPILEATEGLDIIEVDPSPGFDYFSGEVHRIIAQKGLKCFYVFDNLSALVEEWATDELLANFFQVTCPFLFELDTVAYFGLTLGKHADSSVARIQDTTQLLINVYKVKGQRYFHPIKVWERYSSQMFLPHCISDDDMPPVSKSGDAAKVSVLARKNPLGGSPDLLAPWASVYRKLLQYEDEDEEVIRANPEIVSLKEELSHMILGYQPDFSRLASKYFRLRDLLFMRNRIIGSGRIGGKAAGMLLARRILKHDNDPTDFTQVLENHDSFYIGSDVFFTFLINNNLFRLRLELTQGSDITHSEFEDLEERFLEGTFPREIMDQFQRMLEYFGQAPIIVRSSSLLEDSFGNAFAGKYRSEFCINQGDPEQRMHAFLQAVKLVYASALNPDATSYRQKRGLADRDEQMALLVQRVSGMRYKNYFFPSMAGVAFSRNLYVWTDRIDPNKGIIRLVFGLGTRAVDRIGGDYPRMIAVSHPDLRPEVGAKVMKYSQREIDLLDLEKNQLCTRHVSEIIEDRDYPHLHMFVSLFENGYLSDPTSSFLDGNPDDYILTFNNLIRKTNMVDLIGKMVAKLEKAYQHPIDTEFTASFDESGNVRINLLQCRPLGVPGTEGHPFDIPKEIPHEDVLFRSNRIVCGGLVPKIHTIVYIDPVVFAALPMDQKKSLGRIVGKINAHPRFEDCKTIMMGPGRWGTSNIELGVNASYRDINNTSVLVEIAREEAGHMPDVSYGTHFFQDLVEAQIIYLPVYPDDAKTEFNEKFFMESPNILKDILPDDGVPDNLIRIIDIESASGGRLLQVVADPQSQKAVCYLE